MTTYVPGVIAIGQRFQSLYKLTLLLKSAHIAGLEATPLLLHQCMQL